MKTENEIIQDVHLYEATNDAIYEQLKALLPHDQIYGCALLLDKTITQEDYTDIKENKISHKIYNLRFEDRILYGDIEIMGNTKDGNLLQGCYLTGFYIAFVPRMIGTADENHDIKEVTQLISFDWILSPADENIDNKMADCYFFDILNPTYRRNFIDEYFKCD